MIFLKCPKCGKENSTGNRFCKNCGYSLESINYCGKCGAIVKKNQNFCMNCGEKIKGLDEEAAALNKSTTSEKNSENKSTSSEKNSENKSTTSEKNSLNKSSSQRDEKNSLNKNSSQRDDKNSKADAEKSKESKGISKSKIIAIIIIFALIIMAAYISGAFSDEVELKGNGFKATFPKGYSMVEDEFMVTSANVVPIYMIYDDNGTNVLNITGIPSRVQGFHNTSDIEKSMISSEFEEIEKVKLGNAEGYKGVETYVVWKGLKTAYVMVDGNKNPYKIDYINEGNLSFLKNASFTEFVPKIHITEPDAGVIYRGMNSVELEGETFTLTAPEGWNMKKTEFENNTSRYDVFTERGLIKNRILDLDGQLLVHNQSDVEELFDYYVLGYWNASDVRPYTIAGKEGFIIATQYDDYVIIVVNGWHAYFIEYSNEESLGVANTIQFK